MLPRSNRKPVWPFALGAMGLLALSACSGGGAVGGTNASSGAKSTTLTIAVNSAPASFDPSRADNGNGLYPMQLAYEPLIRQTGNGTYSPGLASSWRYLGEGNTRFQLTIRSGVTFSDGSPVTAQAVADSINYFATGFGPTTGNLAGVKATASGADTVTLTSKTANPEFPLLLSQNFLAGDIISPAGLKKKSSLTSKPSGAGPYVLDSGATVPGEHYTFTANPAYYDKTSVHYKKVVIKVIADQTAELSALQTGQVDLMFGTAQQMPTAKSAGLTVTNTGPTQWNGVFLLDREGTKTKALASPQVRQALNYAVDRSGIAKAVYGALGSATDQPTTEGFDEYVPSLANYYTHDPAKAKQLLAQAGYPNGFSMSLTYTSFDPQTKQMVQALAQQWAAIGVKVKLVSSGSYPAMSTNMYQAGALSVAWNGQPMFLQMGVLWLAKAGLNPYHATDASFLNKFAQASKAPQSQLAAQMADLAAVAVKQAYTVPVVQIDTVVFSRGVKGIPSQLPGAHLNVVELHP
ncbi:ABC transporter substrate-binding protein [Streptomyces sp. NBC_00243]|uniref:ABC transporter substrate-binding protein n=1 Tax=Streptomyces sp. NBC_00243 TaxID=2975688 RepID=UPI002DDA7248|nr:ABC transporter substrate-binding protein [Streptomyces sp. NBC_00243]WRZ24824.1 ABC transporter substrate-binding protein [Streptomyces sp. NBC_00243]